MDSTWFVVSYVLLWVILAGFALMLLATLRQVGMLHQRLGPRGALETLDGPDLGMELSELGTTGTFGGSPVMNVVTKSPRTLLVVLQPGCSACEYVVPALRRLMRERANGLTCLAGVTGGSDLTSRDYVNMQDFPEGACFFVSGELPVLSHVGSPFALVLDSKMRVLAKGIVNNREQIESLLESAETSAVQADVASAVSR